MILKAAGRSESIKSNLSWYYCSSTQAVCWTVRCVKGFLSFSHLAFTNFPPEVTN